jgi:hypothetical protein
MADPIKIKNEIARKRGIILAQIAIGSAVGLLANFLFGLMTGHFAQIYDWARHHSFYLGIPLLTLFALMSGTTAFWVRGRYPVIYGATEVAVGVLATLNALARSDIPNLGIDVDPSVVIQIVGGIYIIVRGLDNVGRGVKGTAFEPWWQWLFPQS